MRRTILIFNILKDGLVLFAYEAPGDRNLEGKLVKRHIKSYWESFELTFEAILKNSNSIKVSETNIDFYKNGLVRFIKNTYSACIQV